MSLGVEPFGTITLAAPSTEAAVATAIALTGTVTATIDEADIVAGGKTIILTITGDTWIDN